ncbi:MAG: hypothetical protein MK171_11090 [Pirellulales bacterium]|nr:hypothetical protein [Pirellulales bacterium]
MSPFLSFIVPPLPVNGRTLSAVALLGLLMCAGCNEKSGPERYDLWGTITYQDRPIPNGFVTFAPDKSKGNSGPGAHANIENGQYRTREGRGTVGGPHVVSVTGFDGKAAGSGPEFNPAGGALVADAKLKVDLPKQSGAFDLKVPAQ